MKLAYLYPEHLGKAHARILQVAATCRALAASGVETHFICGRFKGLNDCLAQLGMRAMNGLRVHPVAMWQSGPGLRAPFSWGRVYERAAWRELQALAGQGVRAALVRHLKLAAYLLPRAEALGLPLLYEAHELFAQTAAEEGLAPAKVASLEAMEDRVLRQASRVLAISRPLADELEGRGVRGPVAVAPSGVDDSFFALDGRRREPDLAAYAGGLGAWKGVDLLLEAVAKASAVRVEVLGGQEGGPDWLRLSKSANSLNLGGRLVMRPRAGQDAVKELLARAGVAVWPGSGRQRISAEFTSPLKLFEYLAAGCAVAAPRLPAAQSVLTHGENALLFAPDDADSLAQALTRLVERPQEARSLARAGRQLAKSYTWRARAQVIKQAAEEVAA